MRPIPQNLRKEMSNDPFYKQCCLGPYLGNCEGVIQWHHHLTFGGPQLSMKWAILPVCQFHHDQARNTFINERLLWIALNRASSEEIKAVSKAIPYQNRLEWLNKIYGKYE